MSATNPIFGTTEANEKDTAVVLLTKLLDLMNRGIAVTGESDVINVDGNPVEVQRGFANVAASQTDSVLVTGVSTFRVRVLAMMMIAGSTATNATFNSKPAASPGVAITCLFANAANSGGIMQRNDLGWFQTDIGQSLTVTTGAGSTTGFLFLYVLV